MFDKPNLKLPFLGELQTPENVTAYTQPVQPEDVTSNNKRKPKTFVVMSYEMVSYQKIFFTNNADVRFFRHSNIHIYIYNKSG